VTRDTALLAFLLVVGLEISKGNAKAEVARNSHDIGIMVCGGHYFEESHPLRIYGDSTSTLELKASRPNTFICYMIRITTRLVFKV